jgi:hypothetical protein
MPRREDLLFRSSNLSSVVTAVNRSSKSIHSAASDTARSSPDANFERVCSLEPRMRSGLRVNELVLPEMKSDKTQKNVTVYRKLVLEVVSRSYTYCKRDIEIIILATKVVKGINKN